MAYNFHFDPVDLPPAAKALRQEVRAFLRQEIEAGTFTPDSERAPFSRIGPVQASCQAGRRMVQACRENVVGVI